MANASDMDAPESSSSTASTTAREFRKFSHYLAWVIQNRIIF